MLSAFFSRILIWCGNHKRDLIRLFYFLSAVFFLVTLAASYLIWIRSPLLPLTYQMGKLFGKLSVYAFLLTTFPGILGRFKLRHPLITLGMMFRRETGIASFFLSVNHVLLAFVIPAITFHLSLFDLLTFEIFGLGALLLLTILYTTSNDFMIKKLGVWWKRLHRTVYLIYWLIFAHIILQGVTTTGILVGIAGTMEIISVVYRQLRP